ncbi:FAD-dependent monooxygenase [Spirillospora sp. CA-294931]|uniref:FAD-dependent monooxygenase n=1 Tax=Spirillospora sp. CA-294931 TaxID=3240042 RepID=UPI003D8B3D7E
MDTQVAVVGAGPTGLMLAGELRLGGAGVVVVERLAAPVTESRASTLHARTMEIFDQRGLLEPLGVPPVQRAGHFGGVPLDLGGAPTRFPGQWKVPQARVEELLAHWATGLGAEIRRGHEVTGLTAGPDRVTVDVTGPAGSYDLAAEYVVGCDGEGGAVRRLAGIGFPGRDAARELLAADVAGIAIRDRRFERLPGGTAVAARRPDGVTRVMVAEHGRPAARRAGRPSFDRVRAAWLRVTGEDIGGGSALWLHAFGDASRLAERYRAGRVLLAGDAAHRQLPAGGQAVNLGVQDAANLGWKLAAQVRGDAPDGLLDTYHDERHATGRRVLRAIEAQALLLLGGPEIDPLRAVLAELIGRPEAEARLAATISGLDVRYEPGPHPLVGARMPHLALDTGAGTVETAALLRGGRGVLLDLSAQPALGKAAAGWAGRVDLVTAARHPGGPVEGLDAVLLRPDGHVAWTGAGGCDPRPALLRWFGSDSQGTSRKGGDR